MATGALLGDEGAAAPPAWALGTEEVCPPVVALLVAFRDPAAELEVSTGALEDAPLAAVEAGLDEVEDCATGGDAFTALPDPDILDLGTALFTST